MRSSGVVLPPPSLKQDPGLGQRVERFARLRAGLETDPREVIRDYLLQLVERGTVWDRPDVVAALEEAGLVEVPRKLSMTLRHQGRSN